MPSTNALYGLTPESQGTGEIIDMYNDSQQERIEHVKSILMSWLIEVTKEPDFRGRFVNHRAFSPSNADIPNRHRSLDDIMMYVIWCTNELLGAVIHSLDGRINTNYLQAVGVACFILSLKLIGGYDWLRERGLYAYMAYLTGGIASQAQLVRLESDILERTEWKGCPVAGISEENIWLGGRRSRHRRHSHCHKTSRRTKKHRRHARTRHRVHRK
jgi:hypothetical protein